MRNCWLAVVLLLLCATAVPLRADIAPEVITRCKQATAFVLIGDEDSGTAFYIGQGLFVTNAHVIEDADKAHQVRLVLDAGEGTQNVITATVLRADQNRDLALLRADAQKLPPALELGQTSALVETTAVTAFGYPFGKDLNVGKSEYPNITVSMGRITALRKEQGRIRRIQIDASLNPGNSGGPIVNNAGQVLGIVESGIVGTGVNFAIPVDQLSDFLYGPTLTLRAPVLTKVAPGKADTLTISLPAGMAASHDLTVGLVLSSRIQDRRNYKATDAGGGNFTVVAPVVPLVDSDLLEATVEEGNSTWSVWVQDRRVQVGGRFARLSDLREIVQGVTQNVVFNSGQKAAAAVVGLNAVGTIQSGKATTIDLSSASRIRLAPADLTVKTVRYEIDVKSGSKLLAHQEGTITGEGARPAVILTPQATDKQTEDKQAADREEQPANRARVTVTIDDINFASSAPREVLTATFAQPDGGVTRSLYKGYVLVKVRGIGHAYAQVYNDAFYLFTDPFTTPQNGHDGGFYQLAFGTGPLAGSNLASNAKNFLVGDLPAYNPAHEYTFVLDTKVTSPTQLHFGVSDAGYDDNEGAFSIQVTQLVPVR
jgi:hypothetical protein